MSENEQNNTPAPGAGPQGAAPPETPAPQEPGKPQKLRRKRRWLRRLKITFIVLIVLAIAARIALYFLLPTVIRRVAAHYGLNCTYERMELSLSGGDVGIWHLKLVPATGGEPLLETGYCRGDISVLALLRGRLDVWRAEVDGADVSIEREADGSIPKLQKLLHTFLPARGAATRPIGQIDLEPPLRIDALRLSRLRVRVLDRSVTPALDTRVDMNVRLSYLGAPLRPTQFEVDVWADRFIDGLHVEGEGRSTDKTLQASTRLVLHGLHPRMAGGYLQALGIKPTGEPISLRAGLRLDASVLPGNKFAGSITLHDVHGAAGLHESFGVDELTVDVKSVGLALADISKIDVKNPHATARLSRDGKLEFAGLEFEAIKRGSSGAASIPPLPRVQIGQLNVAGGDLQFDEQYIARDATLRLGIRRMSSRDIVLDAARPDQPFALRGEFFLPGLAESAVVDLQTRPLGERKTAHLELQAEGIRPDVLRPYLELLGVQSELKDAALKCTVDASATVGADGVITADATASKLSLTDGAELLAMDHAKIAGLRIDPAHNRLRVESIDVSGPGFRVRHDADGAVNAFGLRVPIPLKLAHASTSGTPTGAGASAVKLPRVEIGRLTWKDLRIVADDQAVAPPAELRVADAGVELSDIVLDLNSKSDGAPGKLRAWLKAPGLAKSFTIEGTVTPRPDAVSLDLKIDGQGLTPAAIRSYLKPLQVEPLIEDGSLAMSLQAELNQSKQGLSGSLAVQKLRLADAGKDLARVNLLRVSGASVRADQVNVDGIELDQGWLRAMRQTDGRLVVAGVRLPVLPKQNAGASASALPVVMLKQLRVRDSAVAWNDQMVKPAVDTIATATMSLDNFTLGKAAGPATLQLTAAVKDVLASATVRGTIVTAPDAQQADLEIAATGVHAGAIEPYLPKQFKVALKDGSVTTKLHASLGKNPKGGYTGQLLVNGLDYRDGSAPLVKLDTLDLKAGRVDLPGQVIALDELSLAGFEADVHRAADGTLSAGGVILPPAPPEASVLPTTRPAAAQGPAAPSLNPEQMALAAKKTLPLLTLGKLDLNVRRLGISDASLPGGPLTIRDLKLENRSRIVWMGKDAASHPPTRLEVQCRIDPLVESLHITTQVAPFATQPSLVAEINAAGIKGDGLTAMLPQLAGRIDASSLKNGQFKGSVEAQLRLDRRVANDFDLSRGFDLNLLLRAIEFRATSSGPVLAGLDELRSEGIRVRPETGSVHIRTLEITKPVGTFVREADGLHALGVVVKLPELPTTRPAESAPTTRPSIAMAPPTPRPHQAPAQPTTRPTGEIRIDRLLVSGMDVRLEDRTLNPPLLVPVNSVDLDARDISTMALYENRPIRFNLLASAGKVSVPKPPRSAGIPGALGDVAMLMGGKKIDTKRETEQRELFSQVVAGGSISLYPKLDGWMKATVSGFELPAVAGIAQYFGVSLNNGTFDNTLDVRFQPDGTTEARTRLVFTDLRMTEPANGPIARHLALPAPLDAVIGTLQDADGSITIPVRVEVKDGQLDGIGSSAVGAMGSVIAKALASSPVKAISGVGSLVGLGGEKKTKPRPPVVLSFLPGYTGLGAAERAALGKLIEELRKEDNLEVTLKHELGSADVDIAGQRANPSRQEAASLAGQMRLKKVQLLQVRAAVAGEARARLAAMGAEEASASLARLRSIDRQLAQTEDSLDRLYALMRPGAERQADRRTRAACIQIGADRLQTVLQAIQASGIRGIDQRVHVINAQFNPSEDSSTGRITITSVLKKD